MKVILSLRTDADAEISSLILPVTEYEYLTVPSGTLALYYIAPYLESLRIDGHIWQQICRAIGQGNTAHGEYGPQ